MRSPRRAPNINRPPKNIAYPVATRLPDDGDAFTLSSIFGNALTTTVTPSTSRNCTAHRTSTARRSGGAASWSREGFFIDEVIHHVYPHDAPDHPPAGRRPGRMLSQNGCQRVQPTRPVVTRHPAASPRG